MATQQVLFDALSTFQDANKNLVAARAAILQFGALNSAQSLIDSATDEQVSQATGGLTKAQITTALSFFLTALAFQGPGEQTVLYSCIPTVPQIS